MAKRSQKPKELRVTWRRYFQLIEKLARSVRDSRYRPDFIVAITTGGTIPGIVLARLFKVPIGFLAAESYRASQGGHRKDRKGRVIYSRSLASTAPGIGTRILLVDDLDDTGDTLAMGVTWLQNRYPGVTVKTAVIWHKTCSHHQPDFSAAVVHGTQGTWPWIIQPLELYEIIELRNL